MPKRAVTKYSSMDEVPEDLKERILPYVSNIDGNTFIIKGLPPELTGGVLARYSRAPTGMRLTLINEFLDEEGNPSQAKGKSIMHRVLVAFGDDSVGELENATVGLENVSQLLTKDIEDRRIGGSPIEQSTRYVVYDQKDSLGRWRYLRPREVMESGLEDKFERVNDKAFEVYSMGVEKLSKFFRQKFPRDQFMIEVQRDRETIKVRECDLTSEDERREFRNAYNFTIRGASCDVGRCVLPASTLTHLGVNGNGRFWTNLLSHLKSSNLSEARERASQLEEELNKVMPTFIKRNRVYEHLRDINEKMYSLASELFKGVIPEDSKVDFIPGNQGEYITFLAASCLYPFTNLSFWQIAKAVEEMPQEKRGEILTTYIGDRKSRRDRTGRGIEAGYPLNFDIIGCFAEYRDLERHRMLTQQRQLLTTDFGFKIPYEMGEIDFRNEVSEVADMMDDLNSDLRHTGLREASQYATLFNHRMRWMFGMNLREFQHFVELRTGKAGHYSYRRITMDMARAVSKLLPEISGFYGFADYSDPDNKIARANEQSRIAGKNIASGVDSGNDLS